MESKISKLAPDSDALNIVVCGDSRGERQLMPAVIESNTGINTINIAVDAGEVVSLIYALDSYDSYDNVYVLSASSWQINDGANDKGYLSQKCFQQLTLAEKLSIYQNNLFELVRMESGLIRLEMKYFLNKYPVKEELSYEEEVLKEDGFRGIDYTLNVEKEHLANLLQTHSWYKNLTNDNVRWRLFKEAMNVLGEKNAFIIVCQPPASPIWKEKTKNTVISKAEEEFSKKMDSICHQFTNIVFYDFYTNDIDLLDNSMYYDYQHLNRKGAEIFSKIFSDSINRELLVRMHDKVNNKPI